MGHVDRATYRHTIRSVELNKKSFMETTLERGMDQKHSPKS